MLVSLMITLTVFHGGKIYVNKTSIDSVESITCYSRESAHSGIFDSARLVETPCTKIVLKSGRDMSVMESADVVLGRIR